jgi:hypothetical protein
MYLALFGGYWRGGWKTYPSSEWVYDNASRAMNIYKIEQLKAEVIARCRKRLEIYGKTDVVLPSNPPLSLFPPNEAWA